MRFVLGIERLLAGEREWAAFLAAKKPATAARYERERNRLIKMIAAGTFHYEPKVPGQKVRSPKAEKKIEANYLIVDRQIRRDEVYKVLSQAAAKVDKHLKAGKGKNVYHSFTAKVELPGGFFYIIRVPMFSDPAKAMRALEDRLVQFVDDYRQKNIKAFKISGIRYYRIPHGYRYRR